MLDASSDLVADRQVILADKLFTGKEFEAFITEDFKAHLLRPDRKDEKPPFGHFGGIRQWVESIFDALKGQLGSERHGARTLEGVMARVACKLLAMAAGIWHNWKIDARGSVRWSRMTTDSAGRSLGFNRLGQNIK